MKIPPKGLDSTPDLSTQNQSKLLENRDRKTGLARAAEVRSDRAEDQVRVSNLGNALQTTLNPSQFAEERRARIDALKAQIREGTYNPPLEDVARAVAQEISFEIFAGVQFKDG